MSFGGIDCNYIEINLCGNKMVVFLMMVVLCQCLCEECKLE